MVFVDDFTAWVTGPTAESNREGIEAIIQEALAWERRSGATFEVDKTAIIHFARKSYKTDSTPFTIKGQSVQPKTHVKILGVVMDAKLKYNTTLHPAPRCRFAPLAGVASGRRKTDLGHSQEYRMLPVLVAIEVRFHVHAWSFTFVKSFTTASRVSIYEVDA